MTLAKIEVEGSNPFARCSFHKPPDTKLSRKGGARPGIRVFFPLTTPETSFSAAAAGLARSFGL
jgi:hypothetical protein